MNRGILQDIFSAAIAGVDPCRAVTHHCPEVLEEYRKGSYRGIHLFAFGKAAVGMCEGAVDCLGEYIVRGIAITKRGGRAGCLEDRRVAIREASHPLPDEDGVSATREIMEVAGRMDERDFALCLISGGASALLVAPQTGISLADKQRTTDILLRAGADIGELNTVRKHLSAVKGGRLARMIYPGRVCSMIISDVIGDRLDIIGSGVTAPDKTTYADSLNVLSRLGVVKEVPESVWAHLSEGAFGLLPETPKPGDPVFDKVRNRIVASNCHAIVAAVMRAEELGSRTVVLSSAIHGEAREVGTRLASEAGTARQRARSEGKPLCLISGGETTVTVKGNGVGGRNMELALAFALAIEGEKGISLLSVGTDGGDGPTDAAGAIVDGHTTAKGRATGLDAAEYLRTNDSYTFLDRVGGLFKTGPTGTNVMDLQIILVNPVLHP